MTNADKHSLFFKRLFHVVKQNNGANVWLIWEKSSFFIVFFLFAGKK